MKYTKKGLIWELEKAGEFLNNALTKAISNKLLSAKKVERLEQIFKNLVELIEAETGKDYWEKIRNNKGKEFEKFLKGL